MTLGNDFAALVAAVGSGRAAFALLVETLRYRGSHSGATHFRNQPRDLCDARSSGMTSICAFRPAGVDVKRT